MRNALRFTLALVAAIVVMLAFRAFFFTTYTVGGAALEPSLTNGDHVLVNRWSYGLRLTVQWTNLSTRIFSSLPERGDLVAFNFPLDSTRTVASRPVYVCFCTALPGDTVRIGNDFLELPGRDHPACVSEQNMQLLSFLYNHYEGRRAVIRNGGLYVDGQLTLCAAFNNDYFWMTSGNRSNCNDSRFFGPVPSSHIIGRVSMLLYSIDPKASFPSYFRKDRTLLLISNAKK